MSAQEFYRVLQESQIPNAFVWYYTSGLSWIVLVIGLAFLSLIIWHVAALWRRVRNEEQLEPAKTIPWRELASHEKVWFHVNITLAAALSCLGLLACALILTNPALVLHLFGSEIDSLYDLSPMGVQLVMDVFLVVALSSVLACLTLGATAIAMMWGSTLKEVLVNPDAAAMAAVHQVPIPVPRSFRARMVLFALALVVVLFLVSRFTSLVRAVSQEPITVAQAIGECRPERLEIVSQEWEEVIASPRMLKATMSFRLFDDKERSLRQRPSSVAVEISGERVQAELRSLSVLDPLDIVVVPLSAEPRDEAERQFAALTARAFLAEFDLVGDRSKDRVAIARQRGNSFKAGDDFSYWPVGAANKLYEEFDQPTLTMPALRDAVLQVIKEWPDRTPEKLQADATKVIVIMRWISDQEARDTHNALVQIANEPQVIESSIKLWVLDIVPSSREDLRADLAAKDVNYTQVQLPANLLTAGMDINVESVPNVLKSQRVSESVKGFRTTHTIVFRTSRIQASRGSLPIYLLVQFNEDESPNCVYVVDHQSGHSQASTDFNVSRSIKWLPFSMIIGTILAYPIGFGGALVVVGWKRLVKSGEHGEKDQQSKGVGYGQ